MANGRARIERGGRGARGGVQSILVAAVLTWGGVAAATPEFPDVVVKTLGLSEITVDPPQGCTLCHTTDSGGTSLRPFGALVQQNGVQPYEDATLEQALGALEQTEPALIADIRAGRDPNDDQSATALPTPQYGCAVARAPSSESAGWSLPFLALGSVLGARRARRRDFRR